MLRAPLLHLPARPPSSAHLGRTRLPVPTRRSLAAAPSRPLIGRYNTTPLVLFRIQSGDKVSLREYESQKKKGRTSYDLTLGKDGLVHPAPGPLFIGPNGMSLRPAGLTFGEIVATFRGPKIRIFEIPANIELPKELVLLHEHSDHYSLQTTSPIALEELNKIMTKFVQPFPVLTKDDYFKKHPMI